MAHNIDLFNDHEIHMASAALKFIPLPTTVVSISV